jgi:hypothetical protein
MAKWLDGQMTRWPDDPMARWPDDPMARFKEGTMRKLLSKRFEAVASILIVAAFAGVAMLLNGGRLAYFGHHPLNHLSNTETIPASSPIYAENVFQGRHIWKPVDFGPEGLSLKDFIQPMYEKSFTGNREQGIGNRADSQFPTPNSRSQGIREGNSDLPHWVHVVARHPDGTVFLDVTGHNLRTNAGINWQEGQMAGTTAAVCTYIALSNTAITPAATDTSLSGEITANGLSRALGTVTHTSNATSYTLANTFTATGTQAAQAAAILNASSSGTMCFENTFTQASLVSGDTLTVTWTIAF